MSRQVGLGARDTDWAAYEARCAALRNRMESFMLRVAEGVGLDASAVWEDDSDDYGFHLEVLHSDGMKEHALDVTFALWDSGDADDGVYGVHGNLMLDVVEWGGRIIGGFSPYNYTSRVWADYGDVARQCGRRRLVSERCNGWRNYQTWNVALWIGNDEGLYNLARGCDGYGALVDALRGAEVTETPDGVAYSDPGLDVDALDELVRET